MATIKTIKPAGGGNYTTLQAWEDWADGQSSAAQWAECYSGGDLGPVLFNQSWSGTASSVNYPRIYAAEGHRWNGDPTSGAYINSDVYSTISGSAWRVIYLTVAMNYLHIDGLRLLPPINHANTRIQISYPSTGIVVENCYVKCQNNAQGYGLLLSSQYSSVVKNCVLDGTALLLSNSSGGTMNVKVYNNLFYNNDTGERACTVNENSGTINVTFRNCIFAANATGDCIQDVGTTPNIDSDYNIYTDSSLTDGGYTAGANDIQNATLSNVITDAANGDFTFVIGGPAEDAGVDLSGDVDVDVAGISRPQNGTYTIGPFESIIKTGVWTSKGTAADNWLSDNWSDVINMSPQLSGYWQGSINSLLDTQFVPENDYNFRLGAHQSIPSLTTSEFIYKGNYVHPGYNVHSINGISITDGVLYYAGSPSSFGTPDTPGSVDRYYMEVMSTDNLETLLNSNSISVTDDLRIICTYNAYSDTDWLPDYRRRKLITIDNTNVDSDLTNFPLLVKITSDTDIGGAIDANGYNIRFTSSDGTTLLSYERQSFLVSSGEATGVFWVNVPTISSGSTTDIYIYYREDSPVDGEDAANVWNSDFAGVWHLESDVSDSTGNNSAGTATGGSFTTGVIGNGYDIGPISGTDNVNLGKNSAINNLFVGGGTISIWIDIDTIGSGPRVIQKYSNIPDAGYRLIMANTVWQFSMKSSTVLGQWQTASGTSKVGTTHIAIVYNSSSSSNDPVIYFDSVSSSITELTTPGGSMLYDNNSNLTVGGNGGNSMDGRIDEVRLSTTSRSAAWIKFEYNNINSGDNELTISDQLNIP